MTAKQHTMVFHDASGKTRYVGPTYTWIEAYENKIAQAICTSLTSVQMFDDPDERRSPRAIAKYSCDVAAALVAEFEEREWLETLPAPQTVQTIGDGQ